MTVRTRLFSRKAKPAGEEGDLEATKWPEAQLPNPSPGCTSVRYCASNERLDIKVGKLNNAQRWKVHEGLICHYSIYFQNAVRKLVVQQGEPKTFDLSDANAGAFALFVDWLYNEEVKEGSNFDRNMTWPARPGDSSIWRKKCGEAWILADSLQAPLFARYTLGKVIQNAHCFSKDSMEHRFQAVPNSPLQHFAAYWVAWRATHPYSQHSQVLFSLHPEENWFRADTRMRGQKYEPLRGRIIDDPRRFEVEHWFSPCAANLTSPTPQTCVHGHVPVFPRVHRYHD